MARYIFTNVGRGNVFRQTRAFLVSRSVAKGYGRRGFVEVGESDGRVNEPRLLKIAFPLRRWVRAFVETHTPIVFPKGQKAKVNRIYGTRGYSGGWPNKFWIQAAFEVDHVVLYNGHLPPGAWNRDRGEKYEAERKAGWNRMWEVLKTHVSLNVDKAQWHAVVMCDANRQTGDFKPHPRAVQVARHKTDYIWAVPAPGYKVVKGESGTKELGIDFHKVLWVDVNFAKE